MIECVPLCELSSVSSGCKQEITANLQLPPPLISIDSCVSLFEIIGNNKYIVYKKRRYRFKRFLFGIFLSSFMNMITVHPEQGMLSSCNKVHVISCIPN